MSRNPAAADLSNQQSALLNVDEVAAMLRCHKVTIWRWMKEIKNFPRPIRVGRNSIAFHEHEIHAYIASRPRM